jgi:hypothetical protein
VSSSAWFASTASRISARQTEAHKRQKRCSVCASHAALCLAEFGRLGAGGRRRRSPFGLSRSRRPISLRVPGGGELAAGPAGKVRSSDSSAMCVPGLAKKEPAVNDFLDEKRQEITKRLKELQPLVDEFRRLEAAVAALAGLGSGPARAVAPSATLRRRGRPPVSGTERAATATKAAAKPAAPAGKRRAGRRKGSGTRAAEALSFVQGQPGITIPELATKMGIKQNYLYRVLPGLEQEGKIDKKGRGWHPKG